ncbi:hypothetical protein [Stutzerimonas nitrititolerans]|uniref:hypothetical protein n=1 Tax=Stutzerimonas nitrititolerans TaxID=2482751 RepID=UPI00289F1F20|nr:hypothetical protein [Stutzerimonas nitrititolerans]
MGIDELSYELEEIIQENLEHGSMFRIETVSTIWSGKHPETNFKTVLTKLFAEKKVSAASKSHCEYHS